MHRTVYSSSLQFSATIRRTSTPIAFLVLMGAQKLPPAPFLLNIHADVDCNAAQNHRPYIAAV